MKGLRPRYLQRKAQEYLIENSNATWNDEVSTRTIQRVVSFRVSSNFLNDEKQTKAQTDTLGQEIKNLRSELQEHRGNSVGGNPPIVDPNQKGSQNATRFCNYCSTNGHTPRWCRKDIPDEKLRRSENEKTTEKKVTLTPDYHKKRGPGNVSEQWIRGQDFQRRNQIYANNETTSNSPTAYQNLSPPPNFAYGNNSPKNGRSYDQPPKSIIQ